MSPINERGHTDFRKQETGPGGRIYISYFLLHASCLLHLEREEN